MRKVCFDEEMRKLDEVEELMKKLLGMHVGDVMYTGVYAKLWKQELDIARHIPQLASWIPEAQVATLPVHAPVYNLQPASLSYPAAPAQHYQSPTYDQTPLQRHGMKASSAALVLETTSGWGIFDMITTGTLYILTVMTLDPP